MRVAKGKVHDVIDSAVATLKQGAGADGIASRKDIKKTLETIANKEERAFVAQFAAFADKRDHKAGARLTGSDLEKTAAYTKQNLVDKYDINSNGLSKAEVAKMSRTGQLAVALAARKAGTPLETDVPTSELGKAIAKFSDKANYMSEGDSSPTFVEAPFAGNLTPQAVMNAFSATIASHYDAQGGDLAAYAIEEFGTAAYMFGVFTDAILNIGTDETELASAAAFEQIRDAMAAHLSDIKVFKVGPKEDLTGDLAVDQGSYLIFVVGKDKGGKAAGFFVESVET